MVYDREISWRSVDWSIRNISNLYILSRVVKILKVDTYASSRRLPFFALCSLRDGRNDPQLVVRVQRRLRGVYDERFKGDLRYDSEVSIKRIH